MNEFDPRFMKDEELQNLLERWNVPGAPQSLDNRVIAGYNNLMGDASARRDSAPNEVVAMKFCNTCQEEFADRFSFCPVDGTPLSVTPTPIVNEAPAPIQASQVGETATASPVYSEAPAATTYAAAANATMIGEFHLTILEDRGLAARLADELGGVAHN